MAARAFLIRLISACLMYFSSSEILGISHRSNVNSTPACVSSTSRNSMMSLITWLRSWRMGLASIGLTANRKSTTIIFKRSTSSFRISRYLTIFLGLMVFLPRISFCMSWMWMLIDPRGFLISWATPAVNVVRAARLSALRRRASLARFSVTSSTCMRLP